MCLTLLIHGLSTTLNLYREDCVGNKVDTRYGFTLPDKFPNSQRGLNLEEI